MFCDVDILWWWVAGRDTQEINMLVFAIDAHRRLRAFIDRRRQIVVVRQILYNKTHMHALRNT